MEKQPAYVNLVGCWLLTFLLTSGKLASLTELGWWWVVAPVLLANSVFAAVATLRVILMKP